MFWRSLKSKVTEDEMNELRDDLKTLRKKKKGLEEEVEQLKLKKRLEVEEIKHLTKVNEERMKCEVESKKIDLEKKYSEDISKFKEEQRQDLVKSLKEFHGKIEKQYKDEMNSMKEMFKLLSDRLPNVNYEITKDITVLP